MIRKTINDGRVLTTVNPDRSPQIEVSYNPYYIHHGEPKFNPQADSEAIAELSTDGVQIDVLEAPTRPLADWPTVVDIIVRFAVISLAAGFFGQVGADFYIRLKEKIKRLASARADGHGNPIDTGVQVVFSPTINGERIIVTVALRASQLDKLGKHPLTLQSIVSFVESSLHDLHVTRVLIAYSSEEPFWTLIYYIDSNGKYITPKTA